jgi:hypothetical protein
MTKNFPDAIEGKRAISAGMRRLGRSQRGFQDEEEGMKERKPR